MTSPPAVSVVMNTFNSGAYLAPAIESVLGQTRRDFELIVVDDASTDGTREQLAHWATRDARLQVLLNDRNLGQAATANRGIAQARARWIALMHHDDLSYPQRLAALLARAEQRPAATFVTSRFDLMDAAGHIRPGARGVEFDWPLAEWFSVCINFLGAHGQVMLNADAMRAVGGYDEKIRHAVDTDLWIRLLDHGPGALVPEALYAYRVQAPNSMSSRSPAHHHPESVRLNVAEIRRRTGLQVTPEQVVELRNFWARDPESQFEPGRVDTLVAQLAANYRPARPRAGLSGKIREAIARTWLSHALRAAKLQGPREARRLLGYSLRAGGARWPLAAASFAWRLARVRGQAWRLH